MALYIQPPTGRISWQKLETFAQKRLDFLMKITEARGDLCRLHEIVCEEGTVTDSECLIVGSVKDKVSHFTLRLLLGGDLETQTFFCQAETALFDFHFSCMSEEEMNMFFCKLDKNLHASDSKGGGFLKPTGFKSQDIASIAGVFGNIKRCAGSWKRVTRLYMAQCSTTHFSVPFQSVLDLLGKRQVTLKRGMARVPFCKLREVVKEQFLSLMQLAAQQASRQLPVASADDRLRTLWRKLKHRYRRRHPNGHGEGIVPGLSLEQVDSMATQFPLCMSSLLQSLRKKHRLGHHARIQLTLFLKDLGLPVHQAIALWQREYSQPCGVGSHCRHSWQEDGGRYTYSIRHLYGLEGARRNYRGHCCESLQQRILGCTEEGGCPFSHWDDTALSTELSRLGLLMPDIADILSLRGAGQLSAACQRCLQSTRPGRAHRTEILEAENVSLQSDCKVEHPSCHQVLISSSPDNLYRTDCGASDELGVSSEVMDTENVLEVQRVKSSDGRPRMPVSGRAEGVRKMGEAPETTLTVTLREQRICKRVSRVVNDLEVCARKRSHISVSETSAYSATTFQKVVKASSSKRSHALSNPKRCKTLPDGTLVCPSEHEHVQTGLSAPSEHQHVQTGLPAPSEHEHVQTGLSAPSEHQHVQTGLSAHSEHQHAQTGLSAPSEHQHAQTGLSAHSEHQHAQTGLSAPSEHQHAQTGLSAPSEHQHAQTGLSAPSEHQHAQTGLSAPSEHQHAQTGLSAPSEHQHAQTGLSAPSEHQHAQTGSLAQDQPASNSEAQAELKESCLWCFDHVVCPSQQARGQSSSTKTSPSVDILKPVQYFQLSYQRLLESLKS